MPEPANLLRSAPLCRTAARHREIVEKNIIPKLGHIPVCKLTAVHIEAFEAELQREGWVKPRAKRKAAEHADAPAPQKRGLSKRLENAA